MDMNRFQIGLIIVSGVLFVLLAIINPLMAPLNVCVRRFISRSRRQSWHPLMVLTHRYNDVLLLSVQILLLALFVGLVWQDWRRAMILTSAMFVQTTVVSASKRLTSIARPPQIFAHVIMRSSSYPSGHSAASMTFALLVPMILNPYLATPLIVIITVYLIFVALITAYGRLYLDMHWLTDLIGGWLLSFITLMLSRMLIT